MQSLRRKQSDARTPRPTKRTIGAPRPINGGAPLDNASLAAAGFTTGTNGPGVKPRGTGAGGLDARKSRVGDKIKKRMSMRYADTSDPMGLGSDSTGIPEVPALPSGSRGFRVPVPRMNELIVEEEEEDIYDYNGGMYGAGSSGGGMRIGARQAVTIDKEAMQLNGFDPDNYLKTKISTLSEAEIKQLESVLTDAKSEASTNLQRSVFQNYEEFVLISKEISTLENDLLELKEGLNEWKNMPSLLSIEDSTSVAADRRRANRSSIADLTKLYATQMATLHSTIEGSAKYLPPLSGRHVVLEIENVWGLNAATYKVEHAAHFVLLDDSLLVARRRKKRSGEGGKLVADKCWALSEISVVDVKDSSDVTRAFRIRKGRENFIYRCEKSSDKKTFLGTYKATAEEYSARRRKEREGEHERRRSMWNADEAGQRGSLYGDIPAVPSLPGSSTGGATSAQAKAEQDVRWVTDFTDDLTVAIALHDWTKALALVDQGKQRLSSMPSLATRLTPLTTSLINALLHALSDQTLRKTGVITLTSHLVRLGQANAARDAFLSARTESVRKRTRTIRFEGEVAHYVTELAIVVFTSIKHTAEWYLASFKENDMASGFIEWATEQIELFANLFKRQVDEHTDRRDMEESLAAMRTQSKRLLRDNNLDFSFLLESLLADTAKLPLAGPSTAAPLNTSPLNVSRPPRGGIPAPIAISPSIPPSSAAAYRIDPPTPTSSSRPTTPKAMVLPPSPSRSAARPPMIPTRSTRSPAPGVVPPLRSKDRDRLQ